MNAINPDQNTSEQNTADLKNLFQLDPAIIHLNHAAVAPWPVVTRDAIIAFAEENSRIGSQRYDQWLQTEAQLKQKLARLINARSVDEIALLKNTSEGLSLVAQGLDFKAGDNIVVPAEEFPSNRVVWQALEADGVEIRLIAITDSPEPEQRLLDAMDSHTRLLSCSSVQYARGLSLDLECIGRACRQNNTLFCVDAIQSLGALRFDVQACQADFVMADGHKWLCAPEGCALFYCRRDKQDMLKLRQYGWHMLQNPFDFSSTELRIANTAQRFESGSPNMLGIAALNASLDMLLAVGMETVEEKLLANSVYLQQQLLSLPGITLLSPTQKGRFAGITTFSKQGIDLDRLYQQLQAQNVICALRGGGIRFSPHFYTQKALMERAVQMVDDFS